MTTCINLLEMFGDKYRITYDEAYNPRNVQKTFQAKWSPETRFIDATRTYQPCLHL